MFKNKFKSENRRTIMKIEPNFLRRHALIARPFKKLKIPKGTNKVGQIKKKKKTNKVGWRE